MSTSTSRLPGRPALPRSRGQLSEAILSVLRGERLRRWSSASLAAVDDPIADDDFQLALYACYELHYRSFEGVDERMEWNLGLLELRAELEAVMEVAVLSTIPSLASDTEDVADVLFGLARPDGGPSLARFLEREATPEQFREFLIHRSIYHLKEADPHSWAIPRLAGGAKAALVEIQADEYGGGRAERMHSALFAKTMRSVGLTDAYGAFLDTAPGITLATVNLISLFGLHRRWRGALVGHLALFEATSSEANRRYANGLRRLGLGPEATDFFDEHVEADAVHDLIAVHDVAAALARTEPEVAADVCRGARALASLDRRFAAHLLDAWKRGHSSLRTLDPAA